MNLNILGILIFFTTVISTFAIAQTNTSIQDQVELGETYKKAGYGSWTLRCVRTNSEIDPCELFQILRNSSGSPVVEFTMLDFEPNASIIAGANVITPLETLLTSQLIVKIGDKAPQSYPFAFCLKIGCVARIGLTKTDLKKYKEGKSATVIIVPVNAPDSPQNLSLSLSGFTAGYAALIAK
jgi:invasion protein IalB